MIEVFGWVSMKENVKKKLTKAIDADDFIEIKRWRWHYKINQRLEINQRVQAVKILHPNTQYGINRITEF